MREEAITGRLRSDFGLTPVIATEIEFYLHGASRRFQPSGVIELINERCRASGIALARAEAERGPDQYEFSLLPSRDVARIVADTKRVKTGIIETFAPFEIRADFAAKPSPEAPGSGLHVHLHLENEDGVNLFTREDQGYSAPLLHSIGGLLALMNAGMSLFAPTPESYARFTAGPNRYLVCPAATNVPLTVSWGANNRTVAIRLPNKPLDNKHLEHRVAGSDADVGAVVSAILAGVHYGLRERCDPGPPIYGDASLEQYNLPRLVTSWEDAKRLNAEDERLRSYFFSSNA